MSLLFLNLFMPASTLELVVLNKKIHFMLAVGCSFVYR